MDDTFFYQCVNCGKNWDNSIFRYLCPICSATNTDGMPPKGVLFIHYSYSNIDDKLPIKDLLFSLWPIKNEKSLPPLKVGETPLYKYSQLGNEELDFDLYIKDDSQNPSYSFKDRASSLVSAYAKENQIKTIITASTGNAGSSLAAICASQNQEAIILLPKSAPIAKLTQVEMYGAQLIKVDGNYDKAFNESIKLSEEKQWFNRNTAYNPLTIEGKKSVSFEIFEQLNEQVPDLVFVPVGDGVIISGVYKGFEDLMKIGKIKQMPIIIAVQSDKSANIIHNLNTEPLDFPAATTKADSISVDVPRNFYMTKYFIEKYNGETCEVTDQEIQDAAYKMSSSYGLFAEPASAAAFAGFLSYKKQKRITKKHKIIILNTGSGLKDISSAQAYLSTED